MQPKSPDLFQCDALTVTPLPARGPHHDTAILLGPWATWPEKALETAVDRRDIPLTLIT